MFRFVKARTEAVGMFRFVKARTEAAGIFLFVKARTEAVVNWVPVVLLIVFLESERRKF